MSWDITLVGAAPLEEPFEDGGTYALGGTCDCELNVTYNYGCLFLFDELDGRVAKETLPILRAFSERFKRQPRAENYWDPTPGNVKAAVDRLITFAERNPDCVWEVR